MYKATPRLQLRHLRENHAQFLTIVGWLNEPDIVRYSEQRHHSHTLKSQILYYKGLSFYDKYLGIFLNKMLIGVISATIDKPNQIANVGIMLGDKRVWGMGYGTEAWRGLCEQLFEDGMRKVEAGCMSCNVSMMAICKTIGMVEEGRQSRHFLVRGEEIDLVHWGKFNEPS